MEENKYRTLLEAALEAIISQSLTRNYGETDVHLSERFFQRAAIIKQIKEILSGEEG